MPRIPGKKVAEVGDQGTGRPLLFTPSASLGRGVQAENFSALTDGLTDLDNSFIKANLLKQRKEIINFKSDSFKRIQELSTMNREDGTISDNIKDWIAESGDRIYKGTRNEIKDQVDFLWAQASAEVAESVARQDYARNQAYALSDLEEIYKSSDIEVQANPLFFEEALANFNETVMMSPLNAKQKTEAVINYSNALAKTAYTSFLEHAVVFELDPSTEDHELGIEALEIMLDDAEEKIKEYLTSDDIKDSEKIVRSKYAQLTAAKAAVLVEEIVHNERKNRRADENIMHGNPSNRSVLTDAIESALLRAKDLKQDPDQIAVLVNGLLTNLRKHDEESEQNYILKRFQVLSNFFGKDRQSFRTFIETNVHSLKEQTILMSLWERKQKYDKMFLDEMETAAALRLVDEMNIASGNRPDKVYKAIIAMPTGEISLIELEKMGRNLDTYGLDGKSFTITPEIKKKMLERMVILAKTAGASRTNELGEAAFTVKQQGIDNNLATIGAVRTGDYVEDVKTLNRYSARLVEIKKSLYSLAEKGYSYPKALKSLTKNADKVLWNSSFGKGMRDITINGFARSEPVTEAFRKAGEALLKFLTYEYSLSELATFEMSDFRDVIHKLTKDQQESFADSLKRAKATHNNEHVKELVSRIYARAEKDGIEIKDPRRRIRLEHSAANLIMSFISQNKIPQEKDYTLMIDNLIGEVVNKKYRDPGTFWQRWVPFTDGPNNLRLDRFNFYRKEAYRFSGTTDTVRKVYEVEPSFSGLAPRDLETMAVVQTRRVERNLTPLKEPLSKREMIKYKEAMLAGDTKLMASIDGTSGILTEEETDNLGLGQSFSSYQKDFIKALAPDANLRLPEYNNHAAFIYRHQNHPNARELQALYEKTHGPINWNMFPIPKRNSDDIPVVNLRFLGANHGR